MRCDAYFYYTALVPFGCCEAYCYGRRKHTINVATCTHVRHHVAVKLALQNELFTLVTDQGFLTESSVVWETLNNVEGDGHFVDAEFRTYRKPEASTHPLPASIVPANSEQQIDHE